MNARRSFVRLVFAFALVTCVTSVTATTEAPLAIVHVQAQSEPGIADPVWIDVAFLTLETPDARRSTMGVVGVHLESGETLVYRAVAATATFDGESLAGAVIELERVNGGPDGGEAATLTVRPHPEEADCLIYDIVGPNVHLDGEAMGRFTAHLVGPRR